MSAIFSGEIVLAVVLMANLGSVENCLLAMSPSLVGSSGNDRDSVFFEIINTKQKSAVRGFSPTARGTGTTAVADSIRLADDFLEVFGADVVFRQMVDDLVRPNEFVVRHRFDCLREDAGSLISIGLGGHLPFEQRETISEFRASQSMLAPRPVCRFATLLRRESLADTACRVRPVRGRLRG